MIDTGEDHGSVGQTFAHPKAAMNERRFRGARPSVGGRILLAVLCGAFFGYLLSVIIAPSLALPFMVCGAMSFGAGAVALFMFRSEALDEYASGFARTDEEVRKALEDIEARKK